MTIVEGSGMRESRSPSRSGLRVVVASFSYSFSISALRAGDSLKAGRLARRGGATPRSASIFLQGVTAELIPEPGRHLHRVTVFLSRDRKSTRPNSSHSQISYAV